MNVKNSSCIFKLAVRTLRKSAKRNIIAIAAITLTTLLITSVLSAVFSLKTASNELNRRMNGCNADAYIDGLSDDEIDMILSDRNIDEVTEEIRVGEYSGHPFDKKPLSLVFLDETGAKQHYITLTKGHMPEKSNEIAVDSSVLNLLGLEEKIGTEITIPYVGYLSESASDIKTETFVLAGVYEENIIGPYSYACCSKDFAEKAGGIHRTNITAKSGAVNLDSIGIQNKQVGYYGDAEASAMDSESLMLLAMFVCVIGFSGYLIIFNIFQISVVNDISYYGLLKTIGVTGKQIKKIIRIQSFILCVVGIPLGIILGTIVGLITSPVIMRSTILAPVSDSFSTSPWIWVLSAVFSLVTVFISCGIPGRIASKISPVEAFRFSEVKIDNKSNKSVSGLTGMAMRNMSRNKKKTILVLLSMALPIVILSLGLSFANNMSFESYYKSDYAFRVSNTDFFNYRIPDTSNGFVKDFVSDNDIEKINSEIGFEEYGSAYTTVGIPIVGNDVPAVIVGYDEALFSNVKVIEGDMAPLFEAGSNAIALDGYCNEETGVGDKVVVNYEETVCSDTRTGEVLENEFAIEKTPAEYLKVESRKKQVEYTICAIVDPSDDLYIGYTFSDSYSFVLPSSRLESDTNGRSYRYLEVFNSNDNATVERAEEYISKYCENNGLVYKSNQTERREFETFENTIRSIVVILCVVLLIIGILNYVNAVLTGILSRSHEFAVLKAIGMTDKQQKKVLVTEGYFYCLGSIILGVIIYAFLHFPMVKMFEGLTYVMPKFSLVPMSLIAIVFIFIGAFIPNIVYSVTAQKTVVERLRINE